MCSENWSSHIPVEKGASDKKFKSNYQTALPGEGGMDGWARGYVFLQGRSLGMRLVLYYKKGRELEVIKTQYVM